MTNQEWREKLAALGLTLNDTIEAATNAYNAVLALLQMETTDPDLEIFYSDVLEYIEELKKCNEKINGMFQKK